MDVSKISREEWDKWYNRKNHGAEFLSFVHDGDVWDDIYINIDSCWETLLKINSYVDWINKAYEENVLTDEEIAKKAVEYMKIIKIQLKQRYGLVLWTDDFIESVRDGSFTDYDGSGCFLNEEGKEVENIRCSVKWLENNKEGHPYVIWFNK